MTGTGAAPAVTAWAVDASGVATLCAMFWVDVSGRGLAAAVMDDDAAGKDSVIDGAVTDEEAADDEFNFVDVDNTAIRDEPCEIAAAPVVCAGTLLAAACDDATLCAKVAIVD